MGDAADDAMDFEDFISDVMFYLRRDCPNKIKKCSWRYAEPDDWANYKCNTCGKLSDGY